MNLNLHLEANAKVLSSLAKPYESVLAPPHSGANPYWERGCHPDVVERVWDEIGAAYPSESRCLIYGTPSLVDPATGIIVVVGYGTAYCVRLPVNTVPDAVELGAELSTIWTGGATTDIREEFGEGWVFGAWLKQEAEWTQKACAELSSADGRNRA